MGAALGAPSAGNVPAAGQSHARAIGSAPLPESAAALRGRAPAFAAARLVLAGALVITLLFGGLIAWAALSRLDSAIHTAGAVILRHGPSPIQHPRGGRIAAVLVNEGDPVRAGQPLLRLEDAALQSDLALAAGRLDELDARRARLIAQRDGLSEIPFPPRLLERAGQDRDLGLILAGQKRLFAAATQAIADEIALLDGEAARLREQTAGLDAELAALERQRELLGQSYREKEILSAKGLFPAARLRELQIERSRLDGRAGSLNASMAQARARIIQIGLEKRRLISRKHEETITALRDLEQARNELARRLDALRARQRDLTLSAPMTGTVIGLDPALARGAVAGPAQILMRIVPSEQQFQVRARLSPGRINDVHPGLEVHLRPLSGPAMGDTPLEGRLSRISPDTLLDPLTGARYYELEIELAGPLPQGRAPQLLAGMPMDVQIITGVRPTWRYLLDPFLMHLSKTFREG